MKKQTRSLMLILTIIFPLGIFSQGIKVSTEEELKADVMTGPCNNEDRLEGVKKLFKKMGAPDEDIKVEMFGDSQNVVVRRKGKTDETIVVGGHYDKVKAGCGIIDNWSGIVILAHLYRTIRSAGTEKSYVFAAFDREELGLRGSRAMAKAIPKPDRAKYCSMVNLDSFGLGYPVVLENASSSSMVKLATQLGKELKVQVTPLTIPGASSDSAAFKENDIPGITISALSENWPQYLHSPNDKLENVNYGSVRVGYVFGLNYLVKIDAGTCQMFR